MESEKTALKRSFFREYLSYKLRGMLAIGITSAAMSFLACVLSGISLLVLAGAEDSMDSYFGRLLISEFGLIGALAGFAGIVVLAIITPIISFKFYRQRNTMDTLGSLPLTYGQRFWGDFLSGFAAISAPFCVMSGIGGILFAVMQRYISKDDNLLDLFSNIIGKDGSLVTFGMQVFVIMLIVIVSMYAVSALVTSCCGKAGSSALYTVIAAVVIPVIIAMYGTFALNCSIGILPEKNIDKILACIPPVGTIASVILDIRRVFFQGFSMMENPLYPIISLIFIAAIIAAAYFIGKRRKAERVGESFVVDTMYHVLTLSLVLAVIGIYISANRVLGLDFSKIPTGALIALIFYLILELVQSRSFKKIWKSLIRYVCVAVVGFGFFAAVGGTWCFGIWKNLPKQSDILEVGVSGSYFFGADEYVYRADDAVSAILSEHNKLLEDPERIYTGGKYGYYSNSLNIEYRLKDGKTVSRYYWGDEGIIRAASEKIGKQKPFSIPALRFLNEPFYEGVTVTYYVDNQKTEIKSSVYEELFAAMKDDIINHYSPNNYSDTYSMQVDITYTNEYGRFVWDRYHVYETYTKTLAILNNPDNYTADTDNTDSKFEEYTLSVWSLGAEEGNLNSVSEMVPDMCVKFNSNSDSEYVKELMSYFMEYGVNDDTDYVSGYRFIAYVKDENGNHTGYKGISNDKREAAIKAILNLIAEQTKEGTIND